MAELIKPIDLNWSGSNNGLRTNGGYVGLDTGVSPSASTMPGYASSGDVIPGASDWSKASEAAPSLWDSFLGTPSKSGWGGLAIGTLGGAANLYMGLQQYNLAKQALATTQEQMNRNYEAQKKTTNAEMEDRQRARVASNPTGYVSVADYMNQNRIG